MRWLLAIALAGCTTTTVDSRTQAIAGGNVVTSGPIAASTVMFVPQGGDGQHGCSASLVDDAHALTAAHCLFGLAAGDTPDLVLSPKVAAGSPRRTVTKFTPFDSGFDNDIAVLVFAGGLPTDYAPVAVAAPDLATAAGDPVVHAGYGQTTDTVNDRGTLHAVDSKLVGPQPNNRYEASSPHASICSGDSGGPDYLRSGAGLVQLGVHVSGDCDSTAVSTDVRRYIDFLTAQGATPTLVSVLDPASSPDAGPTPPDAGAGTASPDAGSAGETDGHGGGGCATGGSSGLAVALAIALLYGGRRRPC